MKQLLNVLAVVCALGAVWFLVSGWLSARRRPGELGFQDWVKHPEYRKAAEAQLAARKSLQVSDDISDGDIQRMVGRLFVERDDDFNFDRLKLVGRNAIPFLIDALGDPRIVTMTFDNPALLANSPLERICDLLEPFGPAEAIPQLQRIAEHHDSYWRMVAVAALGNIGTSECIEPVVRALGDEDAMARSGALRGIGMALQGQRCGEEFRNAVFPTVARLVESDDDEVDEISAGILVSLDSDRAMSILMSDERLRPGGPKLKHFLGALNHAGSRIPHSKLVPLLQLLRPMSEDYPHSDEYVEALIAYGHNPDTSAEELFRTELRARDPRVQTAAAKALALLAGVSEPTARLLDKKRAKGFASLSEPQRLYLAVYGYHAEVCNGGHAQYFVNPSGAEWRTALQGLKSVSAGGLEKILQDAIALFGPEGPSTDHDQRHRQLSKFSKSQDAAMTELDNRYFKRRENPEALLLLYAAANKEEFRESGTP